MKIAVIGGSGLYDLEGLEDLREHRLETPFGAPSEAVVQGRLGAATLYFLPRHGRGHRLLPSELNHRANIFALKLLGAEAIISISAVGSFREDLAPGDIVVVDQFVDRTRRGGGESTFFGGGLAAHIGFAHPTCEALRESLFAGIKELLAENNPHHVAVHRGGTYLNMEGPAFSTRAESLLYKSWGMDVIGMTNMAEARLAREAEICYCTLAMVTDYDCWHEGHEAVSVEMVVATLLRNAALAKEIVSRLAPALDLPGDCPCRSALRHALITAPEAVPQELRERLAPIVGKYLS